MRRDITALHNAGKLVKVFGGAVASDHVVTPQEPTVAQKITVHVSEKQRIAEYAARLIGQGRVHIYWMQERQPDICWSSSVIRM